jgi:protein-S-isoprenylcysteine O-methyltransferase Ste14
MRNTFRHLSSWIAPTVMGFILPYLIIVYERRLLARPWISPSIPSFVTGLVIAAAGFCLLVVNVVTLVRIGRGTIMPWDPTRRLVVSGLYRHVRNPMILSLLVLQAGWAVLFRSPGVALLAALFFVANTAYFILSEEPGLEKRFGAEYVEYRRSVPRWIPRLKPWQPPGADQSNERPQR